MNMFLSVIQILLIVSLLWFSGQRAKHAERAGYWIAKARISSLALALHEGDDGLPLEEAIHRAVIDTVVETFDEARDALKASAI